MADAFCINSKFYTVYLLHLILFLISPIRTMKFKKSKEEEEGSMTRVEQSLNLMIR